MTVLVGVAGMIVTWVTVTNGVNPNFSFDQYRKSSAPGSGFREEAPQMVGQARHEPADVGRVLEHAGEVVNRMDRPLLVVVREDLAGPAGQVGADVIQEHLFEQ